MYNMDVSINNDHKSDCLKIFNEITIEEKEYKQGLH